MFRFHELSMNGATTMPQIGDRLVYDEKNGTIFVHREGGEVTFREDKTTGPVSRLFVGKAWTRKLTRASAELYARLGGLKGGVEEIEGSFPTLHVYEVRD
jgi:hypothetical protein